MSKGQGFDTGNKSFTAKMRGEGIQMKDAQSVIKHFGFESPYSGEQVDQIIQVVAAAKSAKQSVSQYLDSLGQPSGSTTYEVPSPGAAQQEFDGAAGGLLALVSSDLEATQQQAVQVAQQVAERKAQIISSIPDLSNQIAAQMLASREYKPTGMAGVLQSFRLPEVRVAMAPGNEQKTLSAAQG